MFPFHLFMFLFLLSCIFLLIFMSDNIWLVARYYEFYLAGLEYVCILKFCAWILLSYLGTVFIPFDLVIQTRSSIFTRTNFPYYWGKAILQRLSNTSWTVRFSLFLVVKKKKKIQTYVIRVTSNSFSGYFSGPGWFSHRNEFISTQLIDLTPSLDLWNSLSIFLSFSGLYSANS